MFIYIASQSKQMDYKPLESDLPNQKDGIIITIITYGKAKIFTSQIIEIHLDPWFFNLSWTLSIWYVSNNNMHIKFYCLSLTSFNNQNNNKWLIQNDGYHLGCSVTSQLNLPGLVRKQKRKRLDCPWQTLKVIVNPWLAIMKILFLNILDYRTFSSEDMCIKKERLE